jgi:hypothetical protein
MRRQQTDLGNDQVMNPLDKQISKLSDTIRNQVPIDKLRVGIQALNAMTSCFQVGGESALRKWVDKKMTPQQRLAVFLIARSGDTSDVGKTAKAFVETFA